MCILHERLEKKNYENSIALERKQPSTGIQSLPQVEFSLKNKYS